MFTLAYILLTNQIIMSKFLTVNERDLIKGFIVAILASILTWLYQLLQNNWSLTLENLKVIGLAWLTAWLWYLVKNLFTNENNEILKFDTQTKNPVKDDII